MAGPDQFEPSVTLHSSWRGIIGGVVGPSAVLLLGIVSAIRGGASVLAIIFVVVGLGLLTVTIVDYPVAARFDALGVHRRMILRRQRLAWDDIDRFTRTRPGLLSGAWRPGANGSKTDGTRRNRGGLVAMVGRRRYLLVDQPESSDEFQLVLDVAEVNAPHLNDTALTPAAGTNPTYLYRRSRWSPHGHSRR